MRIGILTGGGDVPGLNAAIKSFVWRMLDEECEILGLRRGWAALTNIIPDASADNSDWIMPLTRWKLLPTTPPATPWRGIGMKGSVSQEFVAGL